jgi:ribosomal protein L37AE/L43A
MKILVCSQCGSNNINRIGLYDYQCNDCGDVFDITEAEGDTDDWFPDDDNDDD